MKTFASAFVVKMALRTRNYAFYFPRQTHQRFEWNRAAITIAVKQTNATKSNGKPKESGTTVRVDVYVKHIVPVKKARRCSCGFDISVILLRRFHSAVRTLLLQLKNPRHFNVYNYFSE